MRTRIRKFYKKRPRRFKKKKLIVLFLILACSILYLFFFSEAFKIKEVQILGSSGIPYREIKDVAEKQLSKNFFFVNSQEIEDEILNEYAEIKEVNLKKKFPSILILKVKKREPKGICCFSPDNCFLIDEEGIIFQGPTEKDLFTIFFEEKETGKPGEAVMTKEKMEQIFEIEKELGIGIDSFVLREGERLDVKTSEGWEIYFDLLSDIRLALIKLKLLLEKEITEQERESLEYIDIRFSKVYYK